MTIGELGSLGELIAAIATVATLLYLALQLRNNSSAIRAEARTANRTTIDATILALAQDESLADLFRRGLMDYESLAPTEHTRFAFVMGSILSSLDAAHEQYESGILSQTYLDNSSNSTRFFLKAPGGTAWWHQYKNRFSESFQKYVDEYVLGSA